MTSGTPSQGMSRRGLLGGALVSGVGAALTAPVARAAQEATPVAGPGSSTIETVSGQAVYTLPRDHCCHGGPFYATDTYWEWHYWTAFVTDMDTGEEGGLFYTTMRTAFNRATGEPVVQNSLSFTNFATQVFSSSSRCTLAGGEQATLPAGSTGPGDFAYSIDSGDGLSLREQYEHGDERRLARASVGQLLDRRFRGVPLALGQHALRRWWRHQLAAVGARTGQRAGVPPQPLRHPHRRWEGDVRVRPGPHLRGARFAGLTAPLWEGALEVCRDASDGPVVGRMYMEEQFGKSDPALPASGLLVRQLPMSGV